MDAKLKSQKMGSMSVGRLLAVMSFPAILSMFVQSMYNVVDTVYVSRLGTEAITALSIAFPVQVFVMAFAIGIGIGTNSLVARRLGAGMHKEASAVAKNGLFLSAAVSAAFVVIGLTLSSTFVSMFTEDAVVRQMGTEYLTIVTVFSAGILLETLLAKTLQATGNMIIPMIAQLIGAVTNIVLDPILIFGYLGFPAMGVKGAAIATVIGQFASLTFTSIMFKIKNHDVNLSYKGFKPDAANIGSILYVGIPSIVINSIMSVTLVILNGHMAEIASIGIPIFGLYYKLQSFIFMPVFGLMQGAMPIMGYNFGANNKERFVKAFRLTIITSLAIMTAGTIIFQAFPEFLLKLFNAEQPLIAEGISALRLLSICFIPAAFGITITTMFQSVGHGMKSLFMSLTRQMGVLLPSALLLSSFLGLKGIWLAFPIAEVCTLAIFLPFAIYTIRKIFALKG
jgi:putative MATE family efflux protein